MSKITETLRTKLSEDRLYHERRIASIRPTAKFIESVMSKWNTEVSYDADVSGTWITLRFPNLPPEQQSQELRDFVRATGIRLVKNFAVHQKAFSATGSLAVDNVAVYVQFTNHMPPSCHLVEETVVVPEHTEVVIKPVCGDATDTADIEANGESPTERA